MKQVVTLVHALDCDFEVKKEPSIYAPSKMLYIIPPGGDFIKMARSVSEAEKETAEWIRRYENVYQGLKYWRARAFENG